MSQVHGQRTSFFPKADAAVLQSRQHAPPSPASRPTAVAPILDIENADKALDLWSMQVAETVYPTGSDIWAPAPVPEKPVTCYADKYLFPVLTRNERLRLTMLFYYTHGVLEDTELMSRLQEKVHLARESVGWEFVIAGLLDHNTYTRMVTVGLPLAVLPRRESTCAHTVNQPPGMIFTLPNMTADWRFQHSPHVEQGGLRSYAGAPLRFETELGEHVAFGSLCVASNTAQEPLSKSQQQALARLADWIVSDIIHSARARRQRERRRMLELLSNIQKRFEQDADMERVVLDAIQGVYPLTTVNIQRSQDRSIQCMGGPTFPASELEHGLWEDSDYFDYLVEHRNHEELVASRVVRVIATQCSSQTTPTYLVVGSNDFRVVFDDVDAWFVNMCAAILCRYWQSHTLKEALAAKENFLRGITHQLRTPIHGILGSVELLVEELNSRNLLGSSSGSSPFATPEVEQLDPYVYIKTIRTSARELISTVNSLIKLNRWADVAQSERHARIYSMEEVEKSLLDEVTQVLRDDVAVRPSIIFTNSLPPHCDLLSIELSLFIDCIQPLVVNAFQNTNDGVISVAISISDDFCSLTVDVEDTGRGISPIDQKRIFGAYEKVDTNTIDAGLGLTLAVKSAKLMNGHLSLVSSEIGKGSHFRVVFEKPVCACSFPTTRSVMENETRRILTFHRMISPEGPSELGRHFSRHLVSSGYVESESPEESLLIIDYHSNLSTLHSMVSRVSVGQVAICLVPDSERFINFDDQMTLEENNVLYVKGPFTSSKLREVLIRVVAILNEHLASTKAVEKATLDCSATITTDLNSHDDILESLTSPYNSTLLPTVQLDLAQSLQQLHIDRVLPVQKDIATPLKPMTLLVDDNTVNLRLLEMYCTRRKIPYRTAIDGKQAVDIFSAHCAMPYTIHDQILQPDFVANSIGPPFKLVLMDLQMPVCDGIDATRQIRMLEQTHGLDKSVVFIVTGQDSTSDRANAEEAGADGYLVKPVGPKALDQSVKQYYPHVALG